MPRLARTIRTAALAAAVLGSAGAAAQSNVVYGLIDASGSYARDVGADRHHWQVDNGNLQRSFIGFRGNEDLGGGLHAVFRLESYLRVDTGSAGRTEGDPFWAREASLGLSGEFGTSVLGRNPSPLYQTTVNFNPFGESPGFSPSARQYFGSRGAIVGDSRWNNSLAYNNSRSDGPLRINFAGNLAEPPVGSTNTDHNLGASVAYVTGPFAIALAAEQIKNSALPVPDGFERQNVYQIGATYDFSLVRVYGQVGRVKTEATLDEQTILYQLGLAVPIGTSVILAAYGNSHIKTSVRAVTDRITSIGYDYFLSKHTDLYVAALFENLSFESSGKTFAGGLRVRF